MHRSSTLVLTARDVAAVLTLDDCITAVEGAFLAFGRGETSAPWLLGLHTAGGGFHVKAGLLGIRGRDLFVAKTNANFPGNPVRHGLPAIQGVVCCFDAGDGRLLAVMDSIALTALRTGAATAVAARWLARQGPSVVTVVGCGAQGRAQLAAVARVRAIRAAYVVDLDPAIARTFADAMSAPLGFPIQPTGDLLGAARASDICITCTPSTSPVLSRETVRDGAFVAGVGADNEHKWELAPDLLAASTIVVDVLEQAATIGDLHHAIEAGVLTREAVHAELGEVLAGKRPGRTSDEEIVVFDSTGMALQDAAAAAVVYEKALEAGVGLPVDFGAAAATPGV